MKQKVLIVALAAVCLAVTGSTVTLSYFTDTSEVTNSFSIGKTDVEFFRWYSPISRYYNSDEAPGVNQRYENPPGNKAEGSFFHLISMRAKFWSSFLPPDSIPPS